MPVLERDPNPLEARRVMWAAEGLWHGYINKEEFDGYIALADVMGETGYGWWAPRRDQMWRYVR
jgi:hypothetical protein